MTRILFLSDRNDCRGPMAEAFARGKCRDNCEVVSAGLSRAALNRQVVKVMGELGLDLSEYTPRTLADVEKTDMDLVITLSPAAARACPVFRSCAYQVNWNLADPADLEGDQGSASILAAYRNTRDAIRRLVDDLFDRGYMDALLHGRECQDRILSRISDAVLVHDLQRRILQFNNAAERLTGYARDEVVGCDCHEVFNGGLCGGKCLLPDGPCEIAEASGEDISLQHRNGETIWAERTILMLRNVQGQVVGAIVIFRDRTREQRLERRVRETQSFAGIVGKDHKMLDMFELVHDLAQSNIPVLIQGESGTGKELVAAAMHNEGPRASKLFVPVNCGSLPETLLESELFGHVRGAFTGAIRDKKGRFELADGGTIFLDEIGDISPAMQVKLLRVLQEGEFVRVGSEETIKVNVRVVSATNKNLTEEIASGRFREDLYYRLSVMPLWIPPLRDRRGDIPLLVEHVLHDFMQGASGRDDIQVTPEAMDQMISYDWPGNVRELQNWIQFALVKCKGDDIRPEHLPPASRSAIHVSAPRVRRPKLDRESVRLALQQSAGNKKMAAEILGVSRATLYRYLKKEQPR